MLGADGRPWVPVPPPNDRPEDIAEALSIARGRGRVYVQLVVSPPEAVSASALGYAIRSVCRTAERALAATDRVAFWVLFERQK
ncbi:MAG TPA: hypothetical protein VF796_21305 [Humisphaera sp.]